MKTVFFRYILACALFIGFDSISVHAQTRVAVLPFRNDEGNINYTKLCYQLSDSLTTALSAAKVGTPIHIVPTDSVEMALSALNINPMNPQYESDKWKAIAQLGVERVVTGNFKVKYGKVFVNAYVFDVATKLADSRGEAKSVYRSESTIMTAVPDIIERLLPAFDKK